MAKPERMAIILLSALDCGLTPAEWQPALTIGKNSLGLMAIGLALIVVGGMLTAIRRLELGLFP